MSAISPAIPCEGIDGSFVAETNADNSFDVRQYMGVKVGSDDNNVTPLASSDTAGTVIVGIAQADADDGESVRVRLSGVSKVRAQSDGVTRGDLCECIKDTAEDKNGNMKTLGATLASGSMIACRALEDAADGEFFKAMITCKKQLATS